jgi:glyoxylase-like metal-dependent hydrolase (beta-lactamase superfamily II)
LLGPVASNLPATKPRIAVVIEIPEGTMLFTSDAIYMGDSYGPPATPAAIVDDLSQWYASVEKLHGIARRAGASVIFGHDAEQLWSLRRSPDGYDT